MISSFQLGRRRNADEGEEQRCRLHMAGTLCLAAGTSKSSEHQADESRHMQAILFKLEVLRRIWTPLMEARMPYLLQSDKYRSNGQTMIRCIISDQVTSHKLRVRKKEVRCTGSLLQILLPLLQCWGLGTPHIYPIQLWKSPQQGVLDVAVRAAQQITRRPGTGYGIMLVVVARCTAATISFSFSSWDAQQSDLYSLVVCMYVPQ